MITRNAPQGINSLLEIFEGKQEGTINLIAAFNGFTGLIYGGKTIIMTRFDGYPFDISFGVKCLFFFFC